VISVAVKRALTAIAALALTSAAFVQDFPKRQGERYALGW
jgi:hypothetical protein